MNKLFFPGPLWQAYGMAIVRIIVGFFMIYHGWEIFDAGKMQVYMGWDQFKHSSAGKYMLYAGKLAELVSGLLLFIGLFTRLAAIILILTMAYIAFFIGKGRIWYEDQHPFLFVLLGMVFIFCGPGSWSIDKLRLNK